MARQLGIEKINFALCISDAIQVPHLDMDQGNIGQIARSIMLIQEIAMTSLSCALTTSMLGRAGPQKRPRHHSYDESVDEPAKLLEQESVEIEEETPSEDSEPMERPEPTENDSPAFDEE